MIINLEVSGFFEIITLNSEILIQYITIEIIEKCQDKPWDWIHISLKKFAKEKELFYQK